MAGRDENIPKCQSYRLVDRLKELNVECERREAREMTHGLAECVQAFPPWEKELGEEWWETAIRPSLDFIMRRVKPTA